jgi:hypothetical protein
MQGELHEQLVGKIYDHLPICNGDHREPKGHGICCCLNSLKRYGNSQRKEEPITKSEKIIATKSSL